MLCLYRARIVTTRGTGQTGLAAATSAMGLIVETGGQRGGKDTEKLVLQFIMCEIVAGKSTLVKQRKQNIVLPPAAFRCHCS